MKRLLPTKVLMFLCIGVFATSAWAKDCEDIQWTVEALDAYPEVGDACQEVVEYNNKEYARMEAKFIRAVDNKAHIRFKHSDGGYGPTFVSRELPDDFKVRFDDREHSLRNIPRDSTIALYVPTERFTIVGHPEQHDSSTGGQMAMAANASDADYYGYDELPATASNTYSLLILAFLSAITAIMVRFTRTHRRR